MRVASLGRLCVRENCIEHALAVSEYVGVPETKHFPALARQIGVADFIMTTLIMLRSVGLDDQSRRNAKEIDYVRSDWNPPAELKPVKAAIAQKPP
jgi:hypothetical protein